ncbi:Cof-type HAD-IIB family hydrolase [Planococcus lenghuensis]|uniref:Hydrolase Cof n=1 Tax=Planococcus lenghuensis TaxID=2213202 RepID=A0A1Q2L1U1_9BACL|nr:Cof-type HAD-IIB family hydrolase [Planococcus lenghuensis]AQQ53852.1 hydrolase Cof [Planococcus lenghuensis]
MKKLLLLDIDGTLLDTNKRLPDSAKSALEKARANGHDLAIATGRAPFMFKRLAAELEVDSFISFNGQYVVHSGQPIHKGAIDKQLLKDVSRFAELRDHPIVYMDEARMVSTIDFHPHISESIKSLKIGFTHPPEEQDFYLNSPVYQALVFCAREEEPAYHESFPDLDFVRWHRVSCDILPAGGSKAEGIKKLIKATGHALEDTIAFGDGLNDVQMMDLAGYSVVMGNGHEEVKKKADYITDHVDEHGLAKAFTHLGLI